MTEGRAGKVQIDRYTRITSTVRSVALAVVVFLAVCTLIDLVKDRPVNVFTGDRAGAMAGISLAIVADAVRRGRSNT